MTQEKSRMFASVCFQTEHGAKRKYANFFSSGVGTFSYKITLQGYLLNLTFAFIGRDSRVSIVLSFPSSMIFSTSSSTEDAFKSIEHFAKI
jgi:hypothetical protein